jgi:Zn ribbon nucleic-acid-binding protein
MSETGEKILLMRTPYGPMLSVPEIEGKPETVHLNDVRYVRARYPGGNEGAGSEVERVKKDWESWLSRNKPELHADVVEHLDSLLSDLRMAVEADASQQGECAKCGADMESRSWRCVECGYIDRAAFRQGVDYGTDTEQEKSDG